MLRTFALYLALFSALFWKAVFGGHSFAQADIYPYYYPVWSFARQALLDGTLPLWNPYLGFGVPFLANPQSCLLYPFSVFWVFAGLARGLDFYIVWHLALAAWGTWFFLREKQAPQQAAFLGGLAFALGGWAMSTVRLTISLCSSAYFPLALVCFERALDRKDFRWKAAAALVLLLQYLAGDPCVSYMTLGVCLVMALRRGVAGVATFASCAALFVALGAFQIVPFAEYVRHSSRPWADYEAVSKWSFVPSDLWRMALPAAFWPQPAGRSELPWLAIPYAGASVLFWVLFCLRRGLSRVEKGLFAMAAAGLLLGLGSHTPVHRLAYEAVPFFRLIRFPERFLLLFYFPLACLAGLGFARAAGRFGFGWRAAALIALVAADLGLSNASLSTVPSETIERPSPNVSAVLGDEGLFRVMSSPRTLARAYHPDKMTLEEEILERSDQFFPNLPLQHRLHSLWNYESVYLREVEERMRALPVLDGAETRRTLRRWNVRYVASPVEELEGFELVQKNPAANLFRALEVWPRAYWTRDPEDGPPQAAVEIGHYGTDRAQMRLEAPTDGWLVFADAYYPGWRARVDGREEAVRRVQQLFRAVPVRAGLHVVDWRYDPLSVKAGSLVSLAAFGFLLLALNRSIKLK